MLDLAEFSNDPFLARETLSARLKNTGSASERATLHYRLWEMCQACGDEPAALKHLDTAMTLDPVQHPRCSNETAKRRVVVLNVPGSFQANAPIAMLMDGETDLYTMWVSGDPAKRAMLTATLKKLCPEAVILAMGEDERQMPAILEAEAIARGSGVPVINRAGPIMGVGRSLVPKLLASIPDVMVPSCHTITAPFTDLPPFPLLVRPVSSHAGNALAKIDDQIIFDRYMQENVTHGQYYVTQFVDYASADGLYRKYRVVFIDGVPYPVHLAIHADWAIWYYNARMEVFPERRSEESRFMQDMTSYFPATVVKGLEEIGQKVGLDYFGLDFGVLQNGTLVVFEVETAMIVHDRDPADIFPYKKACIARIRQAFEDMIDQRAQAWAMNAERAVSSTHDLSVMPSTSL
ncbi:ATP-grasp domain-containing protein [Acetobacter conturbans]|uniref:hypothetical protein n=1 Tax=Acetobacter conturbans TaxID=1737472 RepID=UPI0015689BEF|nr:hypothetical protein [Acetobacter conturbans]